MKSKYLLEKITGIYIFLIIVLFPLIVDKTGFFNILECKWKSFVGISSVYTISVFFIGIYALIKKEKIFDKRLSIIQILAIIFLGINILSCLISPFFKDYNLLIGTGRGEGLIVSSLYILSFLLVSLFGKFNKRYILYFGLSNVLVSFIAVLQYIGFNPFNMFQDGIGTHNVSFMATIGNVDFISAYYTIYLAISVVALLIYDNNKYEKLIHYLAVFLGVFIFQVIDVRSGVVAFLALLFVIIPIAFKDNIRLSKFLKIVMVILLSFGINLFLNVEYHYDIGRVGFYFRIDYVVILFFIMSIILYVLSRYIDLFKYEIKWKHYYSNYYKGLVILGFIGVFCLFVIPFKSGMLYEIHELLHLNFDDNFGTFRIFLWKRTIPLIWDYPLLGTGPDTFALRFMPLYSQDIAAIGPLTINDTAANIYLTMFVNLGIVGGLCYIIFLFSHLFFGIKCKKKETIIIYCAIISYMVGSFFNLSVVIISPMFWVLLGIHHLSLGDEISFNFSRRKK